MKYLPNIYVEQKNNLTVKLSNEEQRFSANTQDAAVSHVSSLIVDKSKYACMSMHVYDEPWTRLFSLRIPSCICSSQPAFQTHTAIAISVEEPRSNLSSPPSLYVGHLLCRRRLAKRNEHGPKCVLVALSHTRGQE